MVTKHKMVATKFFNSSKWLQQNGHKTQNVCKDALTQTAVS